MLLLAFELELELEFDFEFEHKHFIRLSYWVVVCIAMDKYLS